MRRPPHDFTELGAATAASRTLSLQWPRPVPPKSWVASGYIRGGLDKLTATSTKQCW